MTAYPKSVIKQYFMTGDHPSQSDFTDLIDSYADTSAAVTSVTGDVTAVINNGVATTTIAPRAVTLAKQAFGTQGQIIYYAASGVPTALTVGASSQVLTVQAGLPVWASAADASVGALIKVGSAQANNSATIDFVNGVGGVVFDGTYPEYKIEITYLTVASAGSADLFFRTTSNGGSSYDSGAGNYSYGALYTNTSASPSGFPSGNAATSIQLNADGVFQQVSGTLSVFAPAATDRRKSVTFQTVYNYNQTGQVVAGVETFIGAGERSTIAAINGFRLVLSTGNFISGTVRLYGVS